MQFVYKVQLVFYLRASRHRRSFEFSPAMNAVIQWAKNCKARAIKQKFQAMFTIANANYPGLRLKAAEPPVNNSYFHSLVCQGRKEKTTLSRFG